MRYAGHSKINVLNILKDNIIDKEANELKILNDFGNVWILFELQTNTDRLSQNRS